MFWLFCGFIFWVVVRLLLCCCCWWCCCAWDRDSWHTRIHTHTRTPTYTCIERLSAYAASWMHFLAIQRMREFKFEFEFECVLPLWSSIGARAGAGSARTRIAPGWARDCDPRSRSRWPHAFAPSQLWLQTMITMAMAMMMLMLLILCKFFFLFSSPSYWSQLLSFKAVTTASDQL